MKTTYTIVSNSNSIEIKIDLFTNFHFTKNHRFTNNKNLEKYIDRIASQLSYIINLPKNSNIISSIRIIKLLTEYKFKVVYY